MMTLKIQKRYFTFWQRLKFFLNISDGISLTFPNMTLEKNESIIIHSHESADTSVAIRAEASGALRVLFSPPSVEKDFIEVEKGTLDIEPNLLEKIKGK